MDRRYFSFAILFSIVFLLVVSIFSPYMSCFVVKDNFACTGTFAVFSRDFQLTNSTHYWPYSGYPLEWPFMTGAFLALTNAMVYYQQNPELVALFLMPILLALFSIGCIFEYEKGRVSWTRYVPLFVLAPVIFESTWTEIMSVFLFIGGYMMFRKRPAVAGILLGLASGVKYLPLLTLPFFLKEAKGQRLKILASWLGTFGFGMVIQYALNPVNFVRSVSFYSNYGVEGSWIAFLFPGNAINYTTETTWIIGSGTVIHSLSLYEAVSAVLVLSALVYIYRLKNYSFEEKLVFVFVDLFVFFWISAPQFLINIVGLLPLVAFKLDKKRYGLFMIANILCFTPFVFLAQQYIHVVAAFWLQVVAQLFVVLFTWIVFVFPKHEKEVQEWRRKQIEKQAVKQ